ncbi:hypothetical protein D3C75_1161500 [compost metagenome]
MGPLRMLLGYQRRLPSAIGVYSVHRYHFKTQAVRRRQHSFAQRDQLPFHLMVRNIGAVK